jgi:hypothetical protein
MAAAQASRRLRIALWLFEVTDAPPRGDEGLMARAAV